MKKLHLNAEKVNHLNQSREQIIGPENMGAKGLGVREEWIVFHFLRERNDDPHAKVEFQQR